MDFINLRKICCLLLFVVICSRTNAHIEGTLFIEHPPKTAFGILMKSSILDINANRLVFSTAPFAEYAPSKYFSIGIGLPNGFFDEKYLFSDMVIAAKGSIPVKNFMVVPLLSLEIPTGSAPATSHHPELVSTIFLEKKLPTLHLYGYPGVRISFSDKTEKEEINVFSPHTNKEIFANIGFSYWLTQSLGIDSRITSYYEDFKEIVPEFQIGAVIQIKKKENPTIKGSLSAFYVPNGIRKGSGAGISFYVSL